MSNSQKIEENAVKMEDDKSTPSREKRQGFEDASGKMAKTGGLGDLCNQQSKLGAWCIRRNCALKGL